MKREPHIFRFATDDVSIRYNHDDSVIRGTGDPDDVRDVILELQRGRHVSETPRGIWIPREDNVILLSVGLHQTMFLATRAPAPSPTPRSFKEILRGNKT